MPCCSLSPRLECRFAAGPSQRPITLINLCCLPCAWVDRCDGSDPPPSGLQAGMGWRVVVAAHGAGLACTGWGRRPRASGSSCREEVSTALLTDTPKAKSPIDNLVWDLPFGEPTSIDYIYAADYGPDMVVSNLCESPWRLHTDFSYGHLATSWKYSDDKLTLTFQLRDDVKFWDGKPLTADDAAYSLLRNMDADLAGYNASAECLDDQGDRAARADGDLQGAGCELFIKEMSHVAGDVVEKAFVEKAGKDFGNATGGVMCSGPFKLDAWNAGKNILLSANADYWNPDGKALPQKVEIRFVMDTTALTQALKTGEILRVPTRSLPDSCRRCRRARRARSTRARACRSSSWCPTRRARRPTRRCARR